MSVPAPFGETVTLIRREVTGQNAGGDDVYTDVETDVDGAIISPRSSTGSVTLSTDTQSRDAVTVGLTVYLPPGTDVEAVDRARVRGHLYEVEAGSEPGIWRSPLTGWYPGVEIALTRTTG